MNKLTLREKLGFGLGDAASNIVFQIVINYMLIFYTDVFGITAAAAGTLMLVVRVFDAVTDPVMGGLADRTNTRWGRYRPYLLWMAPPYAIMAVLAFTTPDLSSGGKLIYAYVTYALLMTFYTAINIPYSALGGVMTADTQERASVQSWRFVLAMLGGAIVTTAMPKLVSIFGEQSQAVGYSVAMGIMATLALFMFLGCFLSTKERVDLSGSESRKNLLQDLGYILKNEQWALVALITLLLLVSVAMKGAVSPFYVKYFLNSPDMVGTFVGGGLLAGVAGALSANAAIRFMCKVQLMKIAAIGIIAGNLALFFVPQNAVYLALVIALVANFFHMILIPMLFSAVPDTVDYGREKQGHAAMGMAVSGHLFALKIGIALGGALAGWMLGWFEYVPNETQSERALSGILIIYSLCTVIAGVLVLLCLHFYRLNRRWAESRPALS